MDVKTRLNCILIYRKVVEEKYRSISNEVLFLCAKLERRVENMDMITFLNDLTQSDDQYITALLVTILVASTIDFLFGWLNARLSSKVEFISGVALYGIIKKMMYFLTLVLFMVIAFLVFPTKIATAAVYTLFIGYLLSEANSILSHLGLTEDGKKGELFRDFLEGIFTQRKGADE